MKRNRKKKLSAFHGQCYGCNVIEGSEQLAAIRPSERTKRPQSSENSAGTGNFGECKTTANETVVVSAKGN